MGEFPNASDHTLHGPEGRRYGFPPAFSREAMGYAAISYRVMDELGKAHTKFPNQHLPWGGGKLTFPEATPVVAREIMAGRCDLKLAEERATWMDVIAEEFFEANAEEDMRAACRELVQVAAMCFRAIGDMEQEMQRRENAHRHVSMRPPG